MLSRKPTRRFHTWNDHERLTLCLLERLECVKPKELTALFNHVYKKRLGLEGFRSGLSTRTLKAQHTEMKLGGKGHDIFCEVEYTSRADLRARFQDSFSRVLQAAVDLDLAVTSKLLREHKIQMPLLPRRQRDLSCISSISELSLDDVDATLKGGTPRERYKKGPDEVIRVNKFNLGRFISSTPHPPRLRGESDSAGNTTRQHPTILFRSAEPLHKFRARRFQDRREAICCPPPFGSPEFRRIVWPHLKRNKAYESPFISFAAKPRTILSRVETAKSEVDTDERQFAIFSFCEMEADAKLRYGTESGPYLVRALFSDTEVSDLPNGYKGVGEWLCYGSVECKPIAVLEANDAISLARCLLNIRTVDAAAGVQLGKHLTLVPNKWKQVVAYCLLTSYKGKKVPQPGTRGYFEVMKGVYGVQDHRERTIAYSVPPSAYDEYSLHEDQHGAENPIMISDDDDDLGDIAAQEMANEEHADNTLKNSYLVVVEDEEEWDMLSFSSGETEIPYGFEGDGKTGSKSPYKQKRRHNDVNGLQAGMMMTTMTTMKKKSHRSTCKSQSSKVRRHLYRISDLWSESDSEDNY